MSGVSCARIIATAKRKVLWKGLRKNRRRDRRRSGIGQALAIELARSGANWRSATSTPRAWPPPRSV